MNSTPKTQKAQLIQATTPAQIAHARELFQEYAASLNFDLCFQSFDTELATLPGDYAPPTGRLLLAYINDEPAGCVALHAWSDSIDDKNQLSYTPGECGASAALHEHSARTKPLAAESWNKCEMKRLFVRPQARGHNLGRQLIDRIIAESRAIGYTHMRLDTVPGTMDRAIELYRKYGFHEIPAYRHNPQPGVLYFELEL